jgi:4-diphosphocytidyl-2-C-methyl-D-erythritol kinase
VAEAETRLAAWISAPAAPAEAIGYNNMEPPAFAKFVALPVLVEQLRREFGVAPRMSGSGSACFLLLKEETDAGRLTATIREAWGASAFVVEARIADRN